jgi:hypothetical protein
MFTQGRETGDVGEVNFAYRKSLELFEKLRKAQNKFQYVQYSIIVCLAAGGFGLLALRPRPVHWTPDLFLWTGVPFLAGFIAQLFRVHARGADRLARLQRDEIRLQLLADQVALEQDMSSRGIYRDPSRYVENGERLIELVFSPDEESAQPSSNEASDYQPTLPFPTLLTNGKDVKEVRSTVTASPEKK